MIYCYSNFRVLVSCSVKSNTTCTHTHTHTRTRPASDKSVKVPLPSVPSVLCPVSACDHDFFLLVLPCLTPLSCRNQTVFYSFTVYPSCRTQQTNSYLCGSALQSTLGVWKEITRLCNTISLFFHNTIHFSLIIDISLHAFPKFMCILTGSQANWRL